MKLISLNTWGGKVFKPLIKFIQKQSLDTDIFCLQEVYHTISDVKNYKNIRANLLEELTKVLPNFNFFYSTEVQGFDATPEPVSFDLAVGKTILIRNNIKTNKHEDILLFGDKLEKNLKKDFSNLPVTLQYISLILQGKLFFIYNVHGTPFPGSKLDTDLRLEHSKKLIHLLSSQSGAKILTGDFNLLPNSQSINIIESYMRNLIKGFNIEQTRSNLSPYFGKPDFQRFADYTFVSNGVNVLSFQVPDIAISDHLPMILEFS